MAHLDFDSVKDATLVAEAVARWAEHEWQGPVTVRSATTLSGGLDNFVHAIGLDGEALPAPWQQDLVIRIAPSQQRLTHVREEMLLQNWIADRGYPAPRVLGLLRENWNFQLPAQIAALVPGVQLLDEVKAHPQRMKELIGLLAKLHVDLHQLDHTDWPTADATGTAAIKRTRLVHERIEAGRADLSVAMRQVQTGLDWCAAHPVDPTICHGDFHPLNVVFDTATGAAVVVDWTDVTLDDPHSDIARTATLFRCAAIAGGSAIERVALRLVGPLLARMYLRAYGQLRPFDRQRLRHWEALHLLNGLAQLDLLNDPVAETSAAGQSFPPWIGRSIERRLQRTLRRAATAT